jgi:hypothetical protein
VSNLLSSASIFTNGFGTSAYDRHVSCSAWSAPAGATNVIVDAITTTAAVAKARVQKVLESNVGVLPIVDDDAAIRTVATLRQGVLM